MSYVYISDITPASPEPSATAKVQALEAQAADMSKTAKSLESAQPAVAAGLRAQADALLKAAVSFRQAAGLPAPATLSTTTKLALGAGALAALGIAWKFGQPRKPAMAFNRRRRCPSCRCVRCKC